MNEFISWATIVGGFSGLLSFIYVVYEKLTSGPKVTTEITLATIYEREPSQTDMWFNYDFTVEIEIGNKGSQLTSILKPNLEIEELSTKFALSFPGDSSNPLIFSRKPSIALEPGFADSYTLRCNHRCETRLPHETFNGVLELKQLKGKKIKHRILFERS